MFRVDKSEVFLECDECVSGFMSLVDGRVSGGFWAGGVDWDSRPATPEEISEAGLLSTIVEDA